MTGTIRIGELAVRSGVSVRSLRYYEEQGLLTSERGPGGHRRYTADQVDRVMFVQRLYAAGLTSRTIVDLLPCVESPGEGTSTEALDRLLGERERLDRHIDDLVRTREALDELIAANRVHHAGLVPVR